MRSKWLAVGLTSWVLCLSLAWAEAASSSSAATEAGGKASKLVVATSWFPDYLDPQLAYTSEGWTAMYDTYIPLLTYRHAGGEAGSEVIPGLAKALPRITNGGRTYTLFLRKGLRYSNGEPVKASDFEYAIERMFKLNSGGTIFYLDIVGAKKFRKAMRGGISGITTDNGTGRIMIHLARPRATFSNELALLFAAPVPPETPARNQTSDPPPGTGPYMFTSSTPGLGWTYARNPQWKLNNSRLLQQLPSGHVDRIEVTVVRNRSAQIRGVESGKLDGSLGPLPNGRYAELKRKYEGTQLRVEPSLSIYYFWMNTRKAPFDDLRVREAINYALDRSALAKMVFGGQFTPSQQILPPGVPGYKKLDLYPHDMARARQLIAEAHPSDREITVWADSEPDNHKASVYYRDLLRRLGFKARLRTLDPVDYFWTIGKTSTPNLDTGWANWFADYPNPRDFFIPTLAGRSILPTNNGNFAQIDNPGLNRTIARLNKKTGPIPKGQYAALDRRYMELAPWAPYGGLTLTTFVSRAIDLDKVIWNPTFGDDLASFQFR